jgi:uncharacterized protein involved in type VI secretion and phage assembly
MADHTDDNRLLAITTVLGPNTLLMNRFSANERISRLFSFELDLMAPLDKASQVKCLGAGRNRGRRAPGNRPW